MRTRRGRWVRERQLCLLSGWRFAVRRSVDHAIRLRPASIGKPCRVQLDHRRTMKHNRGQQSQMRHDRRSYRTMIAEGPGPGLDIGEHARHNLILI